MYLCRHLIITTTTSSQRIAYRQAQPLSLTIQCRTYIHIQSQSMIPRIRIANLLLIFLSAIILGDLATPVAANGITVGNPPADASKASKNGKNGKAGPSSLFNIQPFTCPRKCVDTTGLNLETMLLEDAIVDCVEEKEGQEWIEHKEGNVVQWESVAYPGMCLAVEHDHDVVHKDTGETTTWSFFILGSLGTGKEAELYDYQGPNYNTTTTVDACTDGVVGLIGCGCPSTKWYNAGSRLLSLSCWEAGFSTSLSVDYDDESGECLSQLKSVQDDSGDVTWASTFMFAEAGSTFGGGLGFPLSDRRLKHEITLINKSPSGIPIYTFKYRSGMQLANNEVLDNKSTFVGAMAQDLLEIATDAVIMNEEDGYYRVDYSKIDVDFYKLE